MCGPESTNIQGVSSVFGKTLFCSSDKVPSDTVDGLQESKLPEVDFISGSGNNIQNAQNYENRTRHLPISNAQQRQVPCSELCPSNGAAQHSQELRLSLVSASPITVLRTLCLASFSSLLPPLSVRACVQVMADIGLKSQRVNACPVSTEWGEGG